MRDEFVCEECGLIVGEGELDEHERTVGHVQAVKAALKGEEVTVRLPGRLKQLVGEIRAREYARHGENVTKAQVVEALLWEMEARMRTGR